MTFKEAFRQARQKGLREFTWGKDKFNTKMRVKVNGVERDETDEEWAAALKKNNPSSAGITYTPGRLGNDGSFTPTGPAQNTFDKSMVLPKNEPVVDQANPFEPGNFNTSMTFNKGNVRANRGTNYSNVDQLWDYIGSHGESTEAQLFNNVLGGLEGDDRKNAFMQMMAKYKVSGNLGRRDSGRLANLFNDLNAIGTEGSTARQSYVDSFNKSFATSYKAQQEAKAKADAAAYEQIKDDPNAQRQMFMLGRSAGAGTLGNQPGFKGMPDASASEGIV